MTEVELYDLQCVKSGWKYLAICLCLAIGFLLTIMTTQTSTTHQIIYAIEQSGYNVNRINTLTNEYYIIEKKN